MEKNNIIDENNTIVQLAKKCINNTNECIFLTGKAGTGKTTFLRSIVQETHKNTIIVAPTGVAAINAGGTTIHSLFQMPFGLFLPNNNVQFDGNEFQKINTPSSILKNLQMNTTKRNMLKELELLIIDEVSMLRADLLDEIDTILRSIRRKNNLPFGGVQVLFIGDLLQLPPVCKEQEWNVLKSYYNGIYFFYAHVFKQINLVYFELTTVYRQQDNRFIKLLNNLRNNEITEEDAELLNQYYQPNFKPNANDNYITLTTHNNKADSMNSYALATLHKETFNYTAKIEGEFNEYAYPLDVELELKIGAQVMFIKNDTSFKKQFYNGKIGKIIELKKDKIVVKCEDAFEPIVVEKYEWENIKYSLNQLTNKIEEKIVGKFIHYPIKLAWAITVHKSQGLTFEKAIIDINSAFAHGQIYVALSRLKSLDGLILLSQINFNAVSPDEKVNDFSNANWKTDAELEAIINNESFSYIKNYSLESFNFLSLFYEVKTHEESYTKDETKSDKQKYKDWATQLLQETISLKNVAEKFLTQLNFIYNSSAANDMNIIYDRIVAAETYFTTQLTNISNKIFEQIKHIQKDKKIKIYNTELLALEIAFYKQLLRIQKTKTIIFSIINNIDYKRDTLEIEKRLDVISKNILYPDTTKPLKEKTKKEDKIPTKETSFKLYNDGKTVAEIATERNLTIGTIENHLMSYIETGQIDIYKFLQQDDIDIILNVAKITDNQLTKIKEMLNDKYEYNTIRFALAYQKFCEL